MADMRSMEELLRIPVRFEKVIVIPPILADEYQINVELLNFIDPFFGFENDDPYSHISRFYLITETFKINQVPDDVVKLILFPLTLKGAANRWLDYESPNSITTWDDLASKFVNRFYPHSKTIELRKEIINFQQCFDETFAEAWERFKDLMRKCPHHGFSELHQVDTFYNSLTPSDQDSLNNAAGGSIMTRTPKDVLTIIENKSRVPISRNKPEPVQAVNPSDDNYGDSYFECLAAGGYTQENVYAYTGPTIPTTCSSLPKVVECETEVTKDMILPTDKESIKDVQPPVDQGSKLEVAPLEESSDTLSMGDKEVKINPLEDIDDFVPIQRVSKKPFDSIHESFNSTFTNPLFDFDSEFTLISDNQIFGVYTKESDESDTETETDEVHVYSSQSTAHVPPPKDVLHKNDSLLEEFADELTHIISPPEYDHFEEDPDPGGGALYHKSLFIEETIPTLPPVVFVAKGVDDKFAFTDEEWILILIKIFLPFFIFDVVSLILHSTGSEDTVFDPGISIAKCPFYLLSPRTN